MNPLAPPLRLAEAAGVLSLATDLAMGQPLEHGLRTAMLALRTAQAMGLPQDDQVTVYYTGLLHFAGCTAESEIDARFFGDELVARARMLPAQFGTRLNLMATMMRVVHSVLHLRFTICMRAANAFYRTRATACRALISVPSSIRPRSTGV